MCWSQETRAIGRTQFLAEEGNLLCQLFATAHMHAQAETNTSAVSHAQKEAHDPPHLLPTRGLGIDDAVKEEEDASGEVPAALVISDGAAEALGSVVVALPRHVGGPAPPALPVLCAPTVASWPWWYRCWCVWGIGVLVGPAQGLHLIDLGHPLVHCDAPNDRTC